MCPFVIELHSKLDKDVAPLQNVQIDQNLITPYNGPILSLVQTQSMRMLMRHKQK